MKNRTTDELGLIIGGLLTIEEDGKLRDPAHAQSLDNLIKEIQDELTSRGKEGYDLYSNQYYEFH